MLMMLFLAKNFPRLIHPSSTATARPFSGTLCGVFYKTFRSEQHYKATNLWKLFSFSVGFPGNASNGASGAMNSRN